MPQKFGAFLFEYFLHQSQFIECILLLWTMFTDD